MNRVMLLMLAVALTACGSSQPSETVDFLVAHPERIKEFNGNARRIVRRSAMNFACVRPKPPIGASSVIDLSRNPNNLVVVAS
jgi:hypothetical protein